MKKVLFVAAFAVLGLVSCKKDYTCECTVKNGESTVTSSSTIHASKKDAKASCESGTVTVGEMSTSCVIK